MSKYIYNLIENGEGQQLDFKFEISDARKIARTLVAFANSEGGKLLIGVKDNGRIAGVRSEEEYYMLESASKLYCKPEVPFTVKKWNIEGKTILEADVAPGMKKPYLANNQNQKWLAYIRVEDKNILVNSVQLRVWKNEKRKKGIFLRYTVKEKILMDYLEQQDEINLPEFARVAKINYRRAQDILVRLVGLKVIKIKYTEKGIKYVPGSTDYLDEGSN